MKTIRIKTDPPEWSGSPDDRQTQSAAGYPSPRRSGARLAAKAATIIAGLSLVMGLGNSRAATGTEMLVNRGFENGTAPWVGAYWGGVSENFEATVGIPAHSGTWMRHLNGNGVAPGFFSVVEEGVGAGNGTLPIPAGAVVHLGAWIKCPDATVGNPCEVRVRPRCNGTGVGTSYNVNLTDGNWTFVGDDGSGTGIIMPFGDWLACRVYGPPVDRDIYVDDVQCLVDAPAILGTVAMGDASDPTGTAITLKDGFDMVLGSSVIDNPSGTYVIPVADGDYSVTASKFGYTTASASVTVSGSDVTASTITLNLGVAIARFEAESASLLGCSIQGDGNASNGQRAAANTFGGYDTVTFTIDSPAAGLFEMTIGYYQPWDASRDTYITVNGTDLGTVACPQTSDPNYATASTFVTLNAGSNTIVLSNGPGWGPHWDYIDLDGPVVSAIVSGTITDGGSPVEGVIVRATRTANPTLYAESAPSAIDGTYSLVAAAGYEYELSATLGLPAGKAVASAPAPFTPADATPITGMDITLDDDPNYDPDLLYSLRSSDYAGGSTWRAAYSSIPGITELTKMGTPTVGSINGQDWVANKQDGDGFRYTNIPQPGTLPFDGGTIVVAARPVRTATGNAYQCLVSNLLFQFSLCVQRDTGQLIVLRKGGWYYGPNIPNGQITVFSVVVQNDGTFKVFLNGDPTPVMNITETSSFQDLTASEWYGTDVSVGKGWNGDGWSSFNGDIGDVYVYLKAIDDTKRETLEDGLIAKYGTATNYTVTTTTGTGGSISPSGAVDVPQNTDKTFTISTNYGYELSDVVVDSVSQGPITSYTFTDVTANHTIGVTWTALVTISGTVSDSVTTDPIYSATVSLSTNPDGSSPIDARTSDASGQYTVVAPNPNGTYYLVARKGGHLTSAVKTVALSGSSVTGQDFPLVKSAGLDPLVLLDASVLSAAPDLASWPNTGSLGGSFDRFVGGSTTPLGPDVTDIGGRQAVDFSAQLTSNGGDADRRTLGGTIVTPAEIAGNSDWSVSADLYKADMGAIGDCAFLSLASWWHGAPKSAQFCYRDNKVIDHNGSGWGFATVPSAGAWHNVTITYDGTTEKVYVDGALDEQRDIALNIATGDQIIIGSHSDVTGPARHWNDQYWRYNGAISRLQIFDQALTAEEVAEVSGIVYVTITASAGPNGTITGPSSAVEGSSPEFNIIPAYGFVVEDVLVDSVSVGAVSNYTFTGVTGDHSISATFTAGPPTTTLVIDLGSGTVIEGGTYGTYGATNLPLPPLPVGSILRMIAVNTVFVATDNENFASELAVLLDPTPGTPGGFSVGIANGNPFGAAVQLGWPAEADLGDPGTPLVDTKTYVDWAAAGAIDLSSTGLFLGNVWGGPILGATWSGTITLTYDLVGGSTYTSWAADHAGGETPDLDFNHDGVANGVAYFMGMNGLATHPGLVSGTVTWPHVNEVTSYEVQTSINLADWTPVAPTTDTGLGGVITYELPTGQGKVFCRLVVTP
ncbi:MAG: carboxypeptidase regulatory-like domain-containing protein [Akkermansiaceae bacterium]|nr:carboxypeptidase regulatory-like domain-containing protein [Akkermansiaceae bacterium]